MKEIVLKNREVHHVVIVNIKMDLTFQMATGTNIRFKNEIYTKLLNKN